MSSITVPSTVESDWEILKNLRLEALQDSPDAFTATFEKTKTHSDSEWRDRVAQKRPCQFLLAFDGMRVGGTIDKQHEFTVVAMWLYENYRGNSVADLLISSLQNMQQTKVIQKLYFVLN